MKGKDKLNEILRENESLPEMRDAPGFWHEFNARAALTPQTGELVEKDSTGARKRWLAPAIAAAAAVVVAAAIIRPKLPQSDNGRLSEVREVEVVVEHSSVMVMKDSRNHGTVIWLSGLDPEIPGT